MPQVISINKAFYTSKRTSFFTFFSFFKCTSGLHKNNLSNQLSNSSTNFGLEIKQPSSRQNPKLLKKNLVYLTDYTMLIIESIKILNSKHSAKLQRYRNRNTKN